MYIRFRLPLWLVTFRVDVARVRRPAGAPQPQPRRRARPDEVAARIEAARDEVLRQYLLGQGRRHF